MHDLNKLVEAFDQAAQDHGWARDVGHGSEPARAKADYEQAKAALLAAVQAPAEDDEPREPAPPHSLPMWHECNRIIENDEFRKRAAAGLEGAVLDLPEVTPKPTALHRFIQEYDDSDPYRSDWFMHRLELVVKEAAQANTQPKGTVPDGLYDNVALGRRECWSNGRFQWHVSKGELAGRMFLQGKPHPAWGQYPDLPVQAPAPAPSDEVPWTAQPQIVRNLLESCANWLESRSRCQVLHIQPDPEEGGGYASLMREYAKNLRELNAVIQAPAVQAWQPIKTAPKDGTHILVWTEASDTAYVVCWADAAKDIRKYLTAESGAERGWHLAWDGELFDREHEPTHWMPLPDAPGSHVPVQGKES